MQSPHITRKTKRLGIPLVYYIFWTKDSLKTIKYTLIKKGQIIANISLRKYREKKYIYNVNV